MVSSVLAALLMIAESASPPAEVEHVTYLLTCDKAVIYPGQTAILTLGVRCDPKVGELCVYNPTWQPPQPGIVSYIGAMDSWISVGGTKVDWLYVVNNPKVLETPGSNAKYFPDLIMGLSRTNPGKVIESDFWILQLAWKPQQWENSTAVFHVMEEKSSGIMVMDLSLGRLDPPNIALEPWPSLSSEDAIVQIRSQPCFADCNNTGTLDVDDFICFQTNYSLGNPVADCDASGSLDIDDFICFQTAFVLGCGG